MESTFERGKTKPKRLFPCLMYSEDAGEINIIIVATGENENGYYEGTCLYTINVETEMGEFSNDWIKNKFTDFHGSVTIHSGKVVK